VLPPLLFAAGEELSWPDLRRVWRPLVQAESLFNDATSLILFRVATSFVVAGGALSAAEIAAGFVWLAFVWLAFGGLAAGAVVAALVALVRRRTEDAVVETVVALLTPYAAYVAAEAVHASGVTAVVVAGVVLGVLDVRGRTAGGDHRAEPAPGRALRRGQGRRGDPPPDPARAGPGSRPAHRRAVI
jgi:CPA1 family monovalent cation:H+ antiporter